MDAMGFLMNSLGIDPEQLKGAAEQVNTTAKDFLARLDRIEKKIDFVAASILTEPGELAAYTSIGGENNHARISSESGRG